MKNKNLIIGIAAAITVFAVIILIGFLQSKLQLSAQTTGHVILEVTEFNHTTKGDYNFSNITALQLLQNHATVNVTESKFGAFVNCINSVCSGNNYYWMYYINNKSANIGAGSYFVKNNDVIEFRYEKS